ERVRLARRSSRIVVTDHADVELDRVIAQWSFVREAVVAVRVDPHFARSLVPECAKGARLRERRSVNLVSDIRALRIDSTAEKPSVVLAETKCSRSRQCVTDAAFREDLAGRDDLPLHLYPRRRRAARSWRWIRGVPRRQEIQDFPHRLPVETERR